MAGPKRIDEAAASATVGLFLQRLPTTGTTSPATARAPAPSRPERAQDAMPWAAPNRKARVWTSSPPSMPSSAPAA
jgi:hypothetical protein